MNASVAVVGGGVSGLAAAHRLVERGLTVQLFEKSSRCGGLLRSEEAEGYVIERGPDSIITTKPAALELAEQLGLAPRIVRTKQENRGAYVVRGGRLHRVPDGFHLLAPSNLGAMFRSPVMDFGGKLRAALELLLPGSPVQDESLAAFVRRRFGPEVLARLAQPMAGGIYGADPEVLGLRSTLPRFLDMEAQHGSLIRALIKAQRAGGAKASGARYGLFISFDKGVEVLPRAIASYLGDRIQTETPVRTLEQDSGRYRVNGKTFDGLVIALPLPAASPLIAALQPRAAAILGGVRLGSAATVTMAFEERDVPHPLDAAGFVVPVTEGRPVIAATWASAKWPGRAPEGSALLRVFLGGHTRQEVASWSESDLVLAARRSLRELMGIRAEPSLVRVDQWVRAMPRYEVGHAERIDAALAHIDHEPRLALAGNGYRGVGIPDSIASGQAAAERVIQAMDTPRTQPRSRA